MNGEDVTQATFNDTCVACNSNCATCDVLPERCTSCPDGYTLKGTRCSNLYNVQFRYVIDTTYATFLSNSEATAFAGKIATLAGVSIDDVYITKVASGSVAVDGAVGSSGQSSANSIQTALTGAVPGYTILSSSATVYYGDSPAPTPVTEAAKPNVPLIVGLTVGLTCGAIIIAIIIYKVVTSGSTAVKSQVEPYDNVPHEKSRNEINPKK